MKEVEPFYINTATDIESALVPLISAIIVNILTHGEHDWCKKV